MRWPWCLGCPTVERDLTLVIATRTAENDILMTCIMRLHVARIADVNDGRKRILKEGKARCFGWCFAVEFGVLQAFMALDV
jgi:hypothetical protein